MPHLVFNDRHYLCDAMTGQIYRFQSKTYAKRCLKQALTQLDAHNVAGTVVCHLPHTIWRPYVVAYFDYAITYRGQAVFNADHDVKQTIVDQMNADYPQIVTHVRL